MTLEEFYKEDNYIYKSLEHEHDEWTEQYLYHRSYPVLEETQKPVFILWRKVQCFFLFQFFETNSVMHLRLWPTVFLFLSPQDSVSLKKMPFIKKSLQPGVNVSQFEDFTLLAQFASLFHLKSYP